MEYISYAFDFDTKGHIRGGETNIDLTNKLNVFLTDYSFRNNVYDGNIHVKDNNTDVDVEFEKGNANVNEEDLKEGVLKIIHDYLSSK